MSHCCDAPASTHTKNGTHPESSGNAPPTAARAHAWRGGYPYHAHFDLAARSTHPPPIHMLIARPGAPPPHICTARIAQAAQRAAHCRGALHAGGAGFLTMLKTRRLPARLPPTLPSRSGTITLRHHRARRHHAPAPSRPAPSQRSGAITPTTATASFVHCHCDLGNDNGHFDNHINHNNDRNLHQHAVAASHK